MTEFMRDGFVVLGKFLEHREVVPIRTGVEALVASRPEGCCSRPHNTLLPLRWSDQVVRQMLQSHRRMERLANGLQADDLKWISGYVSIKEPHSPGLGWHQDWWCWDHPITFRRSAPQVAVLCYLADTTASNGALRVLPGSHHRRLPLHAALPEPHTLAASGLEPDHVAMCDHTEQRTISLRAGDAVAIDYRLLHGTHANASNVRRDCILLSFAPSWHELPADIRGHLISHPALPSDNERASMSWREMAMLPRFDGIQSDLPMNRRAPTDFCVVDHGRAP